MYSEMSKFKDLGIVIPVKKDSVRVPNKNFKPFTTIDGQSVSLLEWKISQLIQVVSPSQIMVSTNEPRVEEITQKYGAVYLPRQEHLCQEPPFSEVITEVVKEVPFTHVAWCTVVVPLMSPISYQQAFSAYFDHVVTEKKYDSLATFNSLKEYYWTESSPLNYEANRNHTISQHLPPLYRITNAVYMRDRKSILEAGYFLGANPYKYLVSKIEGIDIDFEEDFKMAQALLPLYVW
jgi:CMP-N-acetylneuraminic acid synthetase